MNDNIYAITIKPLFPPSAPEKNYIELNYMFPAREAQQQFSQNLIRLTKALIYVKMRYKFLSERIVYVIMQKLCIALLSVYCGNPQKTITANTKAVDCRFSALSSENDLN